jgi:cyanate permease
LDKVAGALTLVFAAVGVGAWQQLLPWWAPFAAFAIILFYGFLRENYEEYLRVETNTALDVSRLKAYESRDTDRVYS